MKRANVIYHRTRISDSKDIFLYFSGDGTWILDKKGPGQPPTDSFIPYHFEELRQLVVALENFLRTGETQTISRDFGEFDKRLTVITADKILNKNGLGVLLDHDDKLWLVGVIRDILGSMDIGF
jgi:hypothetical protein